MESHFVSLFMLHHVCVLAHLKLSPYPHFIHVYVCIRNFRVACTSRNILALSRSVMHLEFRVGEKERSWHSLSRIIFALNFGVLCSRGAVFRGNSRV